MDAEVGMAKAIARAKAKAPGKASAVCGPARYQSLAEIQAEAEGEVEARSVAVFDIETEAWDRFVVGGIIEVDGTYCEEWDENALFDRIIAQGPRAEVFTWNGGRFDFLWFLEIARRRDITCDIAAAGARITHIQVKQGPTLKDAFAVAPVSLQKAAAIAGITLTKETGLLCRETPECVTTGPVDLRCKGYCAIRREGMTAKERGFLSKYLKLDCEATRDIVLAIRAEADRSGYVLKGTIGGTAYATAKKICGFENAEWAVSTYDLARSGYYGGRVEVYRPRAPSGFARDLASAYPWALMVTKVPVGERIVIHGPRAGRAFLRGREGIYEADVFVPNMFIPPLPVRYKERVIFPVGYIEGGAWTRIELEAALNAGVVVRRWGRAVVWESAEAVCAPFVQQAWSRRAEAIAADNPGLKEWHKLVANSFTGKCAQTPDMERVLLCPDVVKLCQVRHPPDGSTPPPCSFGDRERCDRLNRSPKCCPTHGCNGSCGAYRSLDGPGGKLWASSFFRIADCAHVHWSAYLTARTRIELREQLIADGEGGRTAVYCDTDSCYSTVERTRRPGSDLGEWKDEGPWREWECLAPKVYRFLKPSGEPVVKAKGLSDITPEGWEAFARGEGVPSTRGVKSLRMAARERGTLFSRKGLTRQSHADGEWFGGRKLGADGLTRAVTVKEFEKG